MQKYTRRTAWVLVVFALLFVLASAFLPAFFCCHACSGSHCPVCVQIRVWHAAQRLFGVGAWSLFAIIVAALSAAFCAYAAFAVGSRRTPVLLKTKLLN